MSQMKRDMKCDRVTIAARLGRVLAGKLATALSGDPDGAAQSDAPFGITAYGRAVRAAGHKGSHVDVWRYQRHTHPRAMADPTPHPLRPRARRLGGARRRHLAHP